MTHSEQRLVAQSEGRSEDRPTPRTGRSLPSPNSVPDGPRLPVTCRACKRHGTTRTMHQLQGNWYCDDADACLSDVQRARKDRA